DLVVGQTHRGIIIRAPGRVPRSQIVRNSRDNFRTRQTPTRPVVLIIPTVEHAHTLPDTCSNNNIYMLLLTPTGASREEHDAHLSHHQPRSVLTVRTLDDEAALL